MRNKSILLILPLALFCLIFFILFRGLSLQATKVPSPLIDKSAPSFSLPDLYSSSKITNKVFIGKVTLVNVWASWCSACYEEHTFLMTLKSDPKLQLIGLNYKDEGKDALTWLKTQGNPYKKVMVDATGTAALDWGVYGTPETFVIDKQGVIRYKQIGPLDKTNWSQTLAPLIQQLESEKT